MRYILVLIVILSAATSSYAETVWVQVRESRVRSKPQFYASTISSVRYGEGLQKVSEDNGWVGVRVGTQQGYLPLSAISPKTIVFSEAQASKVTADPSELVLAGKGFSKEVEQSFKRADRQTRYDLVDRVERVANVSPAEVARFATQGGLGQ